MSLKVSSQMFHTEFLFRPAILLASTFGLSNDSAVSSWKLSRAMDLASNLTHKWFVSFFSHTCERSIGGGFYIASSAKVWKRGLKEGCWMAIHQARTAYTNQRQLSVEECIVQRNMALQKMNRCKNYTFRFSVNFCELFELVPFSVNMDCREKQHGKFVSISVWGQA